MVNSGSDFKNERQCSPWFRVLKNESRINFEYAQCTFIEVLKEGRVLLCKLITDTNESNSHHRVKYICKSI